MAATSLDRNESASDEHLLSTAMHARLGDLLSSGNHSSSSSAAGQRHNDQLSTHVQSMAKQVLKLACNYEVLLYRVYTHTPKQT